MTQLIEMLQWLKGPFIPSVSINAARTLDILFSLKAVESFQNGVATDFGSTSLVSTYVVLHFGSQTLVELHAK